VGCGLGIEVYRTAGTIQSNTVSGATYGILLFDSNVTTAQNTVSSSATGVALYTASGSVTGNQIDAGGQIGVSLVGYVTTKPVVQGNTISNSSTAILGCDSTDDDNANGYTVTGNIVRDAAVGIQMPPDKNIISPNTYYATATVMAKPCE
jgi:parallel beta-helix repeat protein